MTQSIIVALLVLICTGYSIKKLFLNGKSGGECSGCGGCKTKRKCSR